MFVVQLHQSRAVTEWSERDAELLHQADLRPEQAEVWSDIPSSRACAQALHQDLTDQRVGPHPCQGNRLLG